MFPFTISLFLYVIVYCVSGHTTHICMCCVLCEWAHNPLCIVWVHWAHNQNFFSGASYYFFLTQIMFNSFSALHKAFLWHTNCNTQNWFSIISIRFCHFIQFLPCVRMCSRVMCQFMYIHTQTVMHTQTGVTKHVNKIHAGHSKISFRVYILLLCMSLILDASSVVCYVRQAVQTEQSMVFQFKILSLLHS